ncbi:MAG: hypothetical protein R3B96_01645 [Pirellulaceae bacterium]
MAESRIDQALNMIALLPTCWQRHQGSRCYATPCTRKRSSRSRSVAALEVSDRQLAEVAERERRYGATPFIQMAWGKEPTGNTETCATYGEPERTMASPTRKAAELLTN